MRRMHLGVLVPIVGALVVLLIGALTVFMVFVVDAPKPALYWLIGAASAFILLVVTLLLLLVNSNTRRPEGIDPNVIPVSERRQADPFGATTEQLFHKEREAVQLPDGMPYGRRGADDVAVVKRLIGVLSPTNPPTPEWASTMLDRAPEDVRREIVHGKVDLGLEEIEDVPLHELGEHDEEPVATEQHN